MGKITNVDVASIIDDYTNKDFGLESICSKYHIGKLKAKELLKANGVEIKGRGGQKLKGGFVVPDFKTRKYQPRDGYHFEAVDRLGGFRTNDYMNNGGHLTTHIEKEYGIPTPTLYDRRMYYMRTGDYWWEQWFDIVEVENRATKKCPYCEWETADVDNKSGAFEVHLRKDHGKSKMEYLEEYPEDKAYFRLANATNNLQMEVDENKFVVCKVCGKKLTRISTEHLRKHNMDKIDYVVKYGVCDIVSNDLHDKLSKQAVIANENMEDVYSSAAETEITDFVRSLGLECYKDRRLLHGKELDIYVPSKGVAIEYNGNFWHTEKRGKDRFYHLCKLNKCNENGISLIQVFEDEYVAKKNLVLGKIRHILGMDDTCSVVVYGRKCSVREISRYESEKFLNDNHLQGFVGATVHIGAFFEEGLIGVMSLTRERGSDWTLVRFASKDGCLCKGVGGKLFSYFVRGYSPRFVKSFADRRWTLSASDNLYTKLGFELVKVLPPDYRYYNRNVDRYKRFHKFGFRKGILSKRYGLPMEMTELEMARSLGYDRIWDCGLFKYVWSRK